MSERVLAAEPAFRDEDGRPSSEALAWPGSDFHGGSGDFDDGDGDGFAETPDF